MKYLGQKLEPGAELGLGSWISSFLFDAPCPPQVRHDLGRGLGIKEGASALEVLVHISAEPGGQTRGERALGTGHLPQGMHWASPQTLQEPLKNVQKTHALRTCYTPGTLTYNMGTYLTLPTALRGFSL